MNRCEITRGGIMEAGLKEAGIMERNMKKLVIILGMHRSGTSLTAQLCQSMGAYLGEENELMGASLGNSDGHFENMEVYRINNHIMQVCGSDWYTLSALRMDFSNPQMIKSMEEIKAVVHKLFEKGDTIAIKDPRISIMLPLWGKVLEELKVEVRYIWVFRNPLEVMESLKKRDGYSSQHGMLLWVHYNLSILRFLKEKKYLLVNYKGLLEYSQTVYQLAGLLGCVIDDDLKWELNQIIKHGYCHSNYSYQDVLHIGNDLMSDLYGALLKQEQTKTDVLNWEKSYQWMIDQTEDRFVDHQVLENIQYLGKREIIIYGAGYYGRQAAKILEMLGYSQYSFCDRDINKQGMVIEHGKVFSIAEIEDRRNLLIIIAIENKVIKKEIEQTLSCLKNVSLLSFFALEAVYKYSAENSESLLSKADMYFEWYKQLEYRAGNIRNVCKSSVLFYQNGKVGSSTVSRSLWNAGIENVHVHRFFFKKDIVGELILGEDQTEWIRQSNVFNFQSSEYVSAVKNEMNCKKIITMVREPIAVDLSTVFQWIGNGVADRFFAYWMKQGKTFWQVVSELMEKIQDRLFEWFDDELKEATGIDVYSHPFDKEKGYTIIKEGEIEILLLKAEKLSNMTDVIRDFVDNQQLELKRENVGTDKEYAHLYKAIKEKIELSREYVEHYYTNHPYMDHFYSREEQRSFLDKWKQYIRDYD